MNPPFSFAQIDTFEVFGHQWQLGSPKWLMLGWAGVVVGLVVLFVLFRASKKQSKIVDHTMIETLVGRKRSWNARVHALCVSLIILMISVALARPQSDPREVEVESRGRDVVFLVDVSRSMLAEDVAPNRLEKSKLWINDLVDVLGNDRVGLVAFAGSSAVISPLTSDRLFFKLALEELSPKSVLVGGTNIGDAVRKTMDIVFVEDLENSINNFQDIVLISDGEDQESLPVEAARQAGSRGVRIIAIGIGSDKGARVPIDPDSSSSRDLPVQSKLQSGTLKAIAAASPGGVYLEVGTGNIDLAQVYTDLISSADQRTLSTSSTIQYTERFMFFLAAALVLILIDLTLVPVGNRKALS